jgi:hypothetical protein
MWERTKPEVCSCLRVKAARELDRCGAHVDPDIRSLRKEETARDAKATPNVEDVGPSIGELSPQHVVYQSEAPSVAHIPDVLLEISLAEEDVVEG